MAGKMRKRFALATISFLLLNVFGNVRACDTWIAMKNATLNRITILAKNSDRPLFDCQPLIFHPREEWPKGSRIYLGRLTIPQVAETYATLGSSPYWCWGYEEGINEYGVAIGNEGIRTKVLTEDLSAYSEGKGPEYGPTGMDLLRLGLERGKTAREALDAMTLILEAFGQFGSGLPTADAQGAYHNSYIIADPREAWILETAGRHWVARRIEQGVTSISNKPSIRTDWDLVSSNASAYAVSRGWWSEEKGRLDFVKAFEDDSPQGRAQGLRSKPRAACSLRLLEEKAGEVDVRWMMRIARDRSSTPSIDLDQTASSCVAELSEGGDSIHVFWWCPSVPSTSCYVPFFVHGNQLPEIVSKAGQYGRKISAPSEALPDRFSNDSYWWRFRELFNQVSLDREARQPEVRAVFDSLETAFEAGLGGVVRRAASLKKANKQEEAACILSAYSAECVDRVLEKVDDFFDRFKRNVADIPDRYRPYVGIYAADFQGQNFTVLLKDDHLALSIPGQMVYDLNDPDAEGKWRFRVTPLAAVSFDETPSGDIEAMRFHKTSILPRNREVEDAAYADNAPESCRPFLGKYSIPIRNIEYTVIYRHGRLAIKVPGEGTPELDEPDENGMRAFHDDERYAVSFVQDSEGRATALHLHQTFILNRLK